MIGGILMLLLPVLVDAEVPWVDHCSYSSNGCSYSYTQFGGADSPTGNTHYVKQVECVHNGVVTYSKDWTVSGTAYQYCSGWDSGNA